MHTEDSATRAAATLRAFLGRAALAAAVSAACVTHADALAPGDIGAVVTFPATGTADGARAGVLNPDGSLVMAGFGNSGATSVLARMTTGGSADAGFGTLGVGFVIYNFNDHLNDELHAIVRMSDGRFVGCGQMGGTGTDFLVARFNSDGTLDTSFNLGAGYVSTTFLTSGVAGEQIDICNAVAVQPDGKVVAAGYTTETGPEHVALVRYDVDGTLDMNFGSGGRLDINASVGPTVDSSAQALLIQPDGKLLVAGNAEGPSNSDFLVLRLNTDGTLDTTFGDNGIARNSIGGFDVANAMVLEPNGRIVLAGQSDGDFALARYAANGALDATFGSGGAVKTPVGPGQDAAYGLVRMPWGRYVAVGTARISTTAQGVVVAAVAYNPDGSLDTYFGDAGKRMQRVTGFTTPPDEGLNGAAVDLVNGRLWGFGYGTPDTDRDFTVVEFGLPDTIFRGGFESP
jgi:uncharacterized delta-60 repeat protein